MTTKLMNPMMQKAARSLRAAFFVSILTLTGCTTHAALPVSERPASWAQPVVNPPIGLFNVYQVTPTLFRSAQPPVEGLSDFAKNQPIILNGQTIKTLINLRGFHDDDPRLSENTTLNYQRIKFNTWHAEDEDVVRFLVIATDPDQQPVLLHCQHGADRTGMMVAVYRIVVQNWDKETALAEMAQGGYGFHTIWSNLQGYITHLDVERIKQQVNDAKAAQKTPQ